MMPEQESRLLGYFIEEAKDHLNTIEQGLLNLPDTLKDSEMVNEIFRAAHSLKGGAAMLGLNSIQQTAHHLEDYFKVLQECQNLRVDQKLESLLLRVFDHLQGLVEHLGTSDLSVEVPERLMLEIEPVFKALNQHLRALTQSKSKVVQRGSTPTSMALALTWFENYVLQQLRQMLQIFKQAETPQSRQQLQECCQKLVLLGQKLKLMGWCELCQAASMAIANRANSYRTLAPIVIKELKQSQELVLAGRAAEIKTSSQLQVLCGTYISSRSLQKRS